MLAYSTFGHPLGERSERIQEAVKIVEKHRIDFEYEGEMAADVALQPAASTYPFCRLSGPANVLVMPAIHSASISTKLMQELGGPTVVGPLLVGLNKPVQIVRSTPGTAASLHGGDRGVYCGGVRAPDDCAGGVRPIGIGSRRQSLFRREFAFAEENCRLSPRSAAADHASDLPCVCFHCASVS